MRKIFILIFISVFSLHTFSIDVKVLKSSLEERQLKNVKMEVLRVKKGKIESSAKEFILTVQKELETCHKNLKKERNISENLSRVSALIPKIQQKDGDWPVKYYLNEIEFLQKFVGFSPDLVKEKAKKEKTKSIEKTAPIRKDTIATTSKTTSQPKHSNSNTPSYRKEYKSQNTPAVQVTPDIKSSSQAIPKKKSSSSKSPSSGSKFLIVVLIIVLVVVGILWIMANMHLFFGGVLAVLIFALYLTYSGHNFPIPPLYLWGGLVADIILWIICYRYSTRCDKCKKWGAMQVVRRELVDKQASSITKTLNRKNSRGEVIGRQEVVVPATVYTYHVHRRCKECGYEDYLIETKKNEKYVFMSLLMLLSSSMTVCAQNRLLERETSKMYKAKIKEYKKTGWKLAGSSKTLEVALLEHYEKMKDPQNVELVGEVSQCKSLNVCKQAAYNNALITYANLAGSTLKGRVVSDLNVDQSDEEGEFDKMYAAYERLVQQEVKGVLTESYAIYKERGGSKQ